MQTFEPRSGTYRMANQLCGGDLADRLTRLRGEGLSHEQIARTLFVDAQVQVSSRTVGSWLQALGIDASTETAAPAPVAQEAS